RAHPQHGNPAAMGRGSRLTRPSPTSRRLSLHLDRVVGRTRNRSRRTTNRDVPGPNSPNFICMVAQDAFEAQLRRHAESYPEIALSFATELMELAQDEHGVSVRLRDGRPGELQTKRASYVMAADGAYSRVRGALGFALVV